MKEDVFERTGHLVPQIMPGGDLTARHPARMAVGVLSRVFGKNELSEIFAPYFGKEELEVVLRQIGTKFNSPRHCFHCPKYCR